MNDSVEKTILVAYASTGSGHKVAAEAIYESLINQDSNFQIKLIDILDFFTHSKSGSKFVGCTTGLLSPVFDITWRKNFTGRIVWGGGQLWPGFLYKNFEQYIHDLNPDVIICTHFVCANAAVKARINQVKKFQIVSVPTDFETEGLWPHKETDLFCVSSEEMAMTLISRKVSEDKILISGIPVASEFLKKYSKIETKKMFSIPSNKKIALVICGANDPGPYKNMRKALNTCISYFAKMDWIHFVFCVGQDSEYADRLMRLANKFDAKNFTILNYTKHLAQLMSASDIALIKPGGLVVSECINQNLPMLLIGKAYAQENINRRYLVSHNAAEHATTYKGAVNLLCDIFTFPNWYKKLKHGVSNLKIYQSSEKICNEIVNHIDEKHLEEFKLRNNIYIGDKPVHSR